MGNIRPDHICLHFLPVLSPLSSWLSLESILYPNFVILLQLLLTYVSCFSPFKPCNILLVVLCRKQGAVPICNGEDIQTYYQPLEHCITGTANNRWKPIHARTDPLNSTELEIHGKDTSSIRLICDTLYMSIFKQLIISS